MSKRDCDCIHFNGILRWIKEGDPADAEVTGSVGIIQQRENICFFLSGQKTSIIPAKFFEIDNHRISQLANVVECLLYS